MFHKTHLEGERAWGSLPQAEFRGQIPVVCCLGSSCLVRKMNDERSEKKNWAGAIDTSSQIFDVESFSIDYSRDGCHKKCLPR